MCARASLGDGDAGVHVRGRAGELYVENAGGGGTRSALGGSSVHLVREGGVQRLRCGGPAQGNATLPGSSFCEYHWPAKARLAIETSSGSGAPVARRQGAPSVERRSGKERLVAADLPGKRTRRWQRQPRTQLILSGHRSREPAPRTGSALKTKGWEQLAPRPDDQTVLVEGHTVGRQRAGGPIH